MPCVNKKAVAMEATAFLFREPDYMANELPQPQVAVACGLRTTKAAAIRSSA